MQIFLIILTFYKKLIIPTVATSLILGSVATGVSNKPFFNGVGNSYIFVGLLFHYYIYEIRNPKEYYFYYNFGLSKLSLWFCSLIINLIIGLTLICI